MDTTYKTYTKIHLMLIGCLFITEILKLHASEQETPSDSRMVFTCSRPGCDYQTSNWSRYKKHIQTYVDIIEKDLQSSDQARFDEAQRLVTGITSSVEEIDALDKILDPKVPVAPIEVSVVEEKRQPTPTTRRRPSLVCPQWCRNRCCKKTT